MYLYVSTSYWKPQLLWKVVKVASSYPKRNRLCVPYAFVEYQLHQFTLASHLVIGICINILHNKISWDVSCKLNKVAAEIVITTFNDFACQFACNYSSVRLEKNYHPNQVLKSIKQNICDGKWHYFTLDNCEYKSLLN